MKTKLFLFAIINCYIGLHLIFSQSTIIDHNTVDIHKIPENAIKTAKDQLHIAYGHTSHGSQLITGMSGLDAFMGGTGLYDWNDGPKQGALDIDDYFVSGDLGHNGDISWATRTRDYLNDTDHSDVNVVIWSWCGGVSDNTSQGIQIYLNEMNSLETEYSNVKFVYMTGHLDGSGLNGNLHLLNEQIRNYCIDNHKILFDFADLETYDPDKTYFGDKRPNDNNDYDTDNNGSRDGNWAVEWQNSHTVNTDWYDCSCAHSKALNCNQKASAAWWLWTSLAGWTLSAHDTNIELTDFKNFPNPFSSKTTIEYNLQMSGQVELSIYNILGKKVICLIDKPQSAGKYQIEFSSEILKNGIYFYRLTAGKQQQTRKMLLIK